MGIGDCYLNKCKIIHLDDIHSIFVSENIQKISPEGAIDHRQWCSEAKPLHIYQPTNKSPEGAKELLLLSFATSGLINVRNICSPPQGYFK